MQVPVGNPGQPACLLLNTRWYRINYASDVWVLNLLQTLSHKHLLNQMHLWFYSTEISEALLLHCSEWGWQVWLWSLLFLINVAYRGHCPPSSYIMAIMRLWMAGLEFNLILRACLYAGSCDKVWIKLDANPNMIRHLATCCCMSRCSLSLLNTVLNLLVIVMMNRDPSVVNEWKPDESMIEN